MSILNSWGIWERTDIKNYDDACLRFKHFSEIKSPGDVQLYRVTNLVGCFGKGKTIDQELELLNISS